MLITPFATGILKTFNTVGFHWRFQLLMPVNQYAREFGENASPASLNFCCQRTRSQ